MSESENYTIPQVLEIIKGHAVALKAAGEDLWTTKGRDPKVLALVGERARNASADLWAIDEAECLRGPPWWSHGDVDIGVQIDVLPLLTLAIETAARDPRKTICDDEQWALCYHHVDHVVRELMAWGAEKTRVLGPGGGTEAAQFERERLENQP